MSATSAASETVETCDTCGAELEEFPVYDITGDEPVFVGTEMDCPNAHRHPPDS